MSLALPRFVTILLVLIGIAGPLRGEEKVDNKLASEAHSVLKRYCHRCHGGSKSEVLGLDVLDRDGLIRARPNQPTYLIPGDPAQSLMWRRMESGDMPPENVKERPTSDELALLKVWISAGAHLPRDVGGPRKFISDVALLSKIKQDLSDMPQVDRPHQRYFSLAHLHNNAYVAEEDLRLFRAAFSKLINSISRSSSILLPTLIDDSKKDAYDGVIFRLDLRDVGWDLALWRKVMKDYPYGLSWNNSRLQQDAANIEQLVGKLDSDGIPYVRVDWFVHRASRPPLYHDLLELPEDVATLEKNLGVNIEQDFLQNRLRRAGFAGSGVSKHNRLIDRHEGRSAGYYYRSYDFKKSFERGVLFRFPLGPRFDRNPFNEHAFEHDGGEVIWSLPNGMQGYLIIDNKGKRINDAPVEVVRDPSEISGSPLVVNGVSCMGCHREGMQAFRDTILGSDVLSAEARDKVEQLYVSQDKMNAKVALDRKRFKDALQSAIGDYVQQGADKDTDIFSFPEPIAKLVKHYERDLGLEEAARELGLDAIGKFNTDGNQRLQELGLGPLAKGYPIPRAMWDTLEESAVSVFQLAAQALGVGSSKPARQPK